MAAKRLFTFGCSFTNYRWMTWADILGQQYREYYNWAQSGAGNSYIFNSIMEADQRFKFGADDTVVVCWTNIMRDDRYIDNRGWVTLGNIMTATNVYTKEFLADAAGERGFLIRDLAYIKSIRDFLSNKTGVEWKFLSMCPILQIDPWDDKKTTHGDVVDLYQDVLADILPSYLEVLGHQYWNRDQHKRFKNDTGGVDYHPTTEEHLFYLDTVWPGVVQNSALREQVAQTPLIMNKRANGSCMQKRL